MKKYITFNLQIKIVTVICFFSELVSLLSLKSDGVVGVGFGWTCVAD